MALNISKKMSREDIAVWCFTVFYLGLGGFGTGALLALWFLY